MRDLHIIQRPRMIFFLHMTYIQHSEYIQHNYADGEVFTVLWNNRNILWQLLHLLLEGRLGILNLVSPLEFPL